MTALARSAGRFFAASEEAASRRCLWSLGTAAVIAPPLSVHAPHGVAPLLGAVALLALLAGPALARRLPPRWFLVLLMLLAAWGALTAAWSPLPRHSLLEACRFALVAIAGTVCVAAARTLVDADRAVVYRLLCVGVAVATMLLAAEIATGWPSLLWRPPASNLVPFNRAAVVLVLACGPMALGAGDRSRPYALPLLLVAFVVVLWLKDDAAKLALAAGIATFMLGTAAPRAAAVLLLLPWLVFGVLSPPLRISPDLAAGLHHDLPSLKPSAAHRLAIWEFAIDRIADRPLLGWGMDASRALPGGNAPIDRPEAGILPHMTFMPLHPHDAALQVRLEMGMPGALLSLLLVGAVLWFIVRRPAPMRPLWLGLAAAASSIALLSFGLWQSWWLACLWLVAALAIAAERRAMPAGSLASAPSAAPKAGGADLQGRTIIFLVTEDWYFMSHRLALARQARDVGMRVVVATRVTAHGDAILREGFTLRPLPWRRRSRNPWHELVSLASICLLYWRERPDIVHHVALKAIVFGALAARLVGVRRQVNAVAGLGLLFVSGEPGTAALKRLVLVALRLLVDRPGSRVVVQNPEDAAELVARGVIAKERCSLVRGSGVDVERFRPSPEPDGPFTVALVARMLRYKGVRTFVGAARRARAAGLEARFLLVGPTDPENPSSYDEKALRALSRRGDVEWIGPTDDVPGIWRRAHLAVLPTTYREGVPKALLEAAACGRPIVTTDMPGCREVVTHGWNGLLVPSGSPRALYDAIAEIASDRERRLAMGRRGRARATHEFSESIIVSQMLEIYRELQALPDAGMRGAQASADSAARQHSRG